MPQSLVSRRQALKVILAAGGSITAVAFLPEKWLKPVIRTGVLPVHAQTSDQWLVDVSSDGGTPSFSTLVVSNINIHVYTPYADVQADSSASEDKKLGNPVPYAPVTTSYTNSGTGSVTGVTPSLPRTDTSDSVGYLHFDNITFTISGYGEITLSFKSGAGAADLGPYSYGK
jgi:hypothetical protein